MIRYLLILAEHPTESFLILGGMGLAIYAISTRKRLSGMSKRYFATILIVCLSSILTGILFIRLDLIAIRP